MESIDLEIKQKITEKLKHLVGEPFGADMIYDAECLIKSILDEYEYEPDFDDIDFRVEFDKATGGMSIVKN